MWSFAQAQEFLREHFNLETGVTNDVARTVPTVGSAGGPTPGRRLDPPSLDRMRRLLAFLGDPQLDLDILHLTGTNGKGSTARMATELLLADGRSVGTYTSPDLGSVTERIGVNGKPIDERSFAEVIEAVALAESAAGVTCSYFELLTAAAFRYFSDIAVEAAVIEVGAGGHWDATNTADGRVAVITNVDLDHQEWFGNTIREIANEKVGIVKPGSTFVIGDQNPDTVAFLEREGARLGAERILVHGVDFACDANRVAVGGRLLTLRTPTTSYPAVHLALHGAHQGENAAIALTAVEMFLDSPLDPEVVAAGFAKVTNPGRLEVMERDPLVILDGAHNPAGAAVLARSLSEDFAANPGRVLVVGFLNGRDPEAMLRSLEANRARLVVVCPPLSPRAMAPDLIVAAARAVGANAVVVPALDRAIERARDAMEEDDLLLITGSLYLIGAARKILGR